MAKRGHELLNERDGVAEAPRESEDEADEDELPPPPEVWHLTTKEQWHQLLEVYKTKVRPDGPRPTKRLRGIPDHRAMIAELERLAEEASTAEASQEIVLHISVVSQDDILSNKTFHYLLVSTPAVVSKLKHIASYGSVNIDVEDNANVTKHEGLKRDRGHKESEQVMLELCKTLFAIYFADCGAWKFYPARPGVDVLSMFYVMGY